MVGIDPRKYHRPIYFKVRGIVRFSLQVLILETLMFGAVATVLCVAGIWSI